MMCFSPTDNPIVFFPPQDFLAIFSPENIINILKY